MALASNNKNNTVITPAELIAIAAGLRDLDEKKEAIFSRCDGVVTPILNDPKYQAGPHIRPALMAQESVMKYHRRISNDTLIFKQTIDKTLAETSNTADNVSRNISGTETDNLSIETDVYSGATTRTA
ncbi:MAG: hypothetical protein ACRCY8_11070 [Dermatophilaceae bacterium]